MIAVLAGLVFSNIGFSLYYTAVDLKDWYRRMKTQSSVGSTSKNNVDESAIVDLKQKDLQSKGTLDNQKVDSNKDQKSLLVNKKARTIVGDVIFASTSQNINSNSSGTKRKGYIKYHQRNKGVAAILDGRSELFR